VSERPSRATGGAIYVEFLIAFLPVFVMFLGAVQLADLHQANLVVAHAAQMTTRAAVVVLPDDPQYYNDVEVGSATGKRREDIMKAAHMSLQASRSLSEVRVTFPSTAGGTDDLNTIKRDDLVRVQLQARFQCRVPLVNHLICGAQSGMRTITAEAALPNQGASFSY
jgi:Flp pilus assembly protein TadG